MNDIDPVRRRIYSGAAVVLTVIAGLASRKFPGLFPGALGKYPGDVLWAQMVYWGIRFLSPSSSVARVSASALAVSFADELSQLYQATWINRIRATTLGHLVLGSTFSWLDMLSYTIGVGLCGLVEVVVMKVARRRLRV